MEQESQESFVNEEGDAVLPGFEGPWEYREPRGRGKGQGQLSSLTQDWYTHPDIVEYTRKLFYGEIGLDPFSCREANEVVKAKVYYTAEMDGLTRPWKAKSCLFNPPWGGTDATAVKRRGVKKLLDSFASGDVAGAVCVLNSNAITTAWFAPLLAFPVCIPPRRIEHWSPEGKGGAPNSGTIIVYVGVGVSRFVEVFGGLGRIMVPYEGYRQAA